MPFILPVVADKEIMREQLQAVDGIIFTGGLDVDPRAYGQERLPKCEQSDPRRDYFDIELFHLAKELRKPTLCICKGTQIAVVAKGGTLYQDLSYFSSDTLEHNQYSKPEHKAHSVHVANDSLLYEILEKSDIMVNSFHHQMIKDLPKEYQITARAPDEIIEAIEHSKKDYFFLAVQWHPEMMAPRGDENMQKIFKRLIQESKHKELT